MQALIFCELGLKTLIQNWDFGGKIGEWVVRCWPPTNSFLLLVSLPLCHFWWKSIKKCDRESADRQTDRQTDRRTDRDKLNSIIWPMLCTVATGQIMIFICCWKHAARHTCSHTWNDHCIADWNQQFHGHLSQPSTFSNSLCYKQVENSKYAEHTSRH